MTTAKIGGAGVGAAAAARLGDDQSAEGAEARVAATMTATTAEGGDIIDIKGKKVRNRDEEISTPCVMSCFWWDFYGFLMTTVMMMLHDYVCKRLLYSWKSLLD